MSAPLARIPGNLDDAANAAAGHLRRGEMAAPAGPAERSVAAEERRAVAPLTSEEAGRFVTELYREHGLTLVRTAMLLVGDKPTAEDVVQEAFAALYRKAPTLTSPDKAFGYLRVSVINGCRSVHRARRTAFGRPRQHEPSVWSAEAAAMAREDTRLTLQAVARLPRRAREVLALRYYLGLPDTEIARTLGVSRGTVSSTVSRALAALARELKEEL